MNILPVVPARGGAEIAFRIYKTFLIYRTCMRRAPAKPVRACILRKWRLVSHVTFEALLRTLHFSLHSSHSLFILHTLHFTLHPSYSTLHTPHFILYNLHFILLTSHCFFNILHFTLYILHCIFYILHFTLHSSYLTWILLTLSYWVHVVSCLGSPEVVSGRCAVGKWV